MSSVAEESGQSFLAQIKVPATDELFGQVSQRAVDWARANAAELVSGVEDSTRDMIAGDIADSLAAGETLDETIGRLQEGYAFSEERADLIARTEIGSANQHGALEGMRAAEQLGIKIMKYWSCDTDPCEDCEANEAASPIPLNEEFPSGDDAPEAHPHCKCSLISEIDESSEAEAADEGEEE